MQCLEFFKWLWGWFLACKGVFRNLYRVRFFSTFFLGLIAFSQWKENSDKSFFKNRSRNVPNFNQLFIMPFSPSYRLRLLRTWSVQPLLRSENLACLELADSRKRGSVCDFIPFSYFFHFFILFFIHRRESRPRLLIEASDPTLVISEKQRITLANEG